MTEHEARQHCLDRNRNPDREMAGPDGPLKAWEMYAIDLPKQTSATQDRATIMA